MSSADEFIHEQRLRRELAIVIDRELEMGFDLDISSPDDIVTEIIDTMKREGWTREAGS